MSTTALLVEAVLAGIVLIAIAVGATAGRRVGPGSERPEGERLLPA
jgi:hypothetical protein